MTAIIRACTFCKKVGKRLHPCVECGALCCNHSIRPIPSKEESGRVGRCTPCFRKLAERYGTPAP